MSELKASQAIDNTAESSDSLSPSASYTASGSTHNISPHFWIAIFIAIMIAIMFGFVLSFLMQNMNNSVPNQNNMPVVQTTQTSNESTTNIPLAEYSDDRIEAMRFRYNPNAWTIKEVKEERSEWLELKSNHGKLTIEYLLPVGIGGGIRFFKTNERVPIKGNLSRVFFGENMYQYGLENSASISLYSVDDNEKQQMLHTCAQSDPIELSLIFLDSEKCRDIQQGNIVGHITGPTYQWSIALKRLAALDTFKSYNADYHNDGDNDTIIVETQYVGTNPKEADVIVMQFAPIASQ